MSLGPIALVAVASSLADGISRKVHTNRNWTERSFFLRRLAAGLLPSKPVKTMAMTYGASASPRYASTVVLVRPDEKGGFDILLTRRPRQMRFMGGFYVFPGGSVHEEDYSAAVLKRCRGISVRDAQTILGDDLDAESALGHWVAAIRELFEEVGVLLCVTESGEDVDLRQTTTKQRLEQKRIALSEDHLDFGTFLEAENLYCELSRLVYFYHRVTPDIYPIRFDTRFFLGRLPAGQTPLARSEEVAESLWLAPSEPWHRSNHHDFPLIPPTSYVLEMLAQFSWDELRARYGLGSWVHYSES